jgi:diguanylate cyclase (GGDEF)-like protein/PAS domain S-box-containing protein
MRKRSRHQARLSARPSRQQELPFPTNVLPVLKDAYYLMAHRPALEHLLAALLKSSEDAVVTVSPEGTIETWSAGAERLYGYAAEEMIGQSLSRLLPVYESLQLESFLSLAGDDCSPVEQGERLHKNGSRILLAMRRSVIRGDKGEAEGILEMAQALDPHEALWSPEEAPLHLMMEQVPGLLWTTDKNLRIQTHWGNGVPAAKIRQPSLKGQNVREFLGVADPHATPIAEHYSALRGLVSHFEYAWKGSVLEIRVGPLRSASGEIIGCLGAAVDVTERKKSEQQALYQARHDGLTGLANYREFMDCLEREVRRAERNHRSFTLLLLDLDELKRINDLQGHLAGNRALRRLAAVMNEHCRSTDLAARYGGDEFAAVLIDSDRGMAENVAQRIEQRLRSDPEKPALSVSIGIGVYPDDGRSPAELIEVADRRLYQRKKNQNQNLRTLSAP